MVPAPTSTSYGCCSTHPRSAQKVCRRRISSWNVAGLELAGVTAYSRFLRRLIVDCNGRGGHPSASALRPQPSNSQACKHQNRKQHCDPENSLMPLGKRAIVRSPAVKRVVRAGIELCLCGGIGEVKEAGIIVDRP